MCYHYVKSGFEKDNMFRCLFNKAAEEFIGGCSVLEPTSWLPPTYLGLPIFCLLDP